MTKSPRQWLDGYAAFKEKRIGKRNGFTMKFRERIDEDYIRLIVRTEIEADRKGRK